MRTQKLSMISTTGLFIVIFFIFSTPAFGNYVLGNGSRAASTISGFVFGLHLQPVKGVTVELRDDFLRGVAQTKTNTGGQYFFSVSGSGRFSVRVLSPGLDYEDQTQDVEIQNSGENVQQDFYLKRRPGSRLSRPESISVQEVPNQARESYKKAVKLFDDKKPAEGLEGLKSALEIFPDYYEALERSGSESIKLKDFKAAEIFSRRAVEINPRGFLGWYNLAYALYSQNKVSEALEAVQKSIALNQYLVEPFLLEGVLQRRSGNFEQAERQLKRASELSEGSLPEAHWQLALLYCNYLKDYGKAAHELELFLKIRPDGKDSESVKKLITLFKEKAGR